MSYRLIDANALNGVISNEDYEKVLDAPSIHADLPNGMDGEHYLAVPAHEGMTNGDVIMTTGFVEIVGNLSNDTFVCARISGITRPAFVSFSKEWWDAPYKRTEG